jgi:hypothetical protein
MAAKGTSVFKVYPQWLQSATDDQLRQQFADLKRRGIALAMEYGMADATPTCGMGVEGNGGSSAVAAAERVKRLGGELRFIGMDEPYYFGALYDGPNACHKSAAQIALEVAAHYREVRQVFPDVEMGDIEPVPAVVAGNVVSDWADQYANWHDTLSSAMGKPPAFFHSDVLWNLSDWANDLDQIRAKVEAKSIAFGVIYNGWPAVSDADYLLRTESHFTTYENGQRMAAADALFQSWHPQPRKVLPEDDVAAFSSAIDRYLRTPTSLDLSRTATGASGQLHTHGGAPVQGSIALSCVQEGGTLGSAQASGIVPLTASKVVLALRINREGAGSGTAELWLSDVTYSENNAVVVSKDFQTPNLDWHFPGSAEIVTIPGASHAVWHVSISAVQSLSASATAVAASPGTPYELTLNAKASAVSDGTSYFAAIFTDDAGKELYRQILPIRALPSATLDVATDRSGRFAWSSDACVRVGAHFSGNGTYRASDASAM